jgi:hypothetical protein
MNLLSSASTSLTPENMWTTVKGALIIVGLIAVAIIIIAVVYYLIKRRKE